MREIYLRINSVKNIQVIDGALNSVFEIYAVSDEVHARLFPDGTDIAFAEEFPESDPIWTEFYRNRVDKKSVRGIDGTLHLTRKADVSPFFPTRKETEVRSRR